MKEQCPYTEEECLQEFDIESDECNECLDERDVEKELGKIQGWDDWLRTRKDKWGGKK